ncbi:MAG TPA: putative metal-binding motif-containing protein, partial [Candidatus Polarisedimenticolia bacterium]|nr:putative metal-binding motif-containing protein [Candidatus Polarisedimenticolia bacterium]
LDPTLDIYGVRITYTPPASPSATVSDAVAAVPFLPEQTSDSRLPFQGTLAGQYRFNTGLQLPDGAQVLSVSMSILDNSDDGDMTASLYRTDSTSSGAGNTLMATLTSSGAAGGVRTFTTDVIRGRVIDNDHYFYYAQFWTGFEPVTALGFVVNTAPCGDRDGDGFDGCVNDCNDNRAATRPGAPEICDGQINNCSVSFWPDATVGTIEGDDDFDGFSECQGDCNDAASSRWSPPSEPRSLMLAHNTGTGVTTLTWTTPLDFGSTTAPVYDTLRSGSPLDFASGAAVCVESNGADLTSTMTGSAPVGGCYYFLIRAEGVCGAGLPGHTSSGAPISGRNCP